MTKIFTEQELSTAAGPFEGDTFELTGIPLDRFFEQQFAEIFQCNICMDIPTDAVILSNCHHVYCEHCIQRWLACNSVCPSCRNLVEVDDVLPLRQQMLTIFDMLTLHCKYSENGCEEKLTVNEIAECEKSCRFSKRKLKRGAYNKTKVFDISRQYSKRGRLRNMSYNLSESCQSHNEDAEDVLFSMLTTTLHDKGKTELAKKVEYLWTEQTDNDLTVDESLANRINTLQTKNQYKKQYDFYITKDNSFSSPCTHWTKLKTLAFLRT